MRFNSELHVLSQTKTTSRGVIALRYFFGRLQFVVETVRGFGSFCREPLWHLHLSNQLLPLARPS